MSTAHRIVAEVPSRATARAWTDGHVVGISSNDGTALLTTAQNLADVVARDRQQLGRVKDITGALGFIMKTVDIWAEARSQKLVAVYLGVVGTTLNVVVETKSFEFDAELSKTLTKVDLVLANAKEMKGFFVETLLIPHVDDSSVDGFIKRDWRLTRNFTNA